MGRDPMCTNHSHCKAGSDPTTWMIKCAFNVQRCTCSKAPKLRASDVSCCSKGTLCFPPCWHRQLPSEVAGGPVHECVQRSGCLRSGRNKAFLASRPRSLVKVLGAGSKAGATVRSLNVESLGCPGNMFEVSAIPPTDFCGAHQKVPPSNAVRQS